MRRGTNVIVVPLQKTETNYFVGECIILERKIGVVPNRTLSFRTRLSNSAETQHNNGCSHSLGYLNNPARMLTIQHQFSLTAFVYQNSMAWYHTHNQILALALKFQTLLHNTSSHQRHRFLQPSHFVISPLFC